MKLIVRDMQGFEIPKWYRGWTRWETESWVGRKREEWKEGRGGCPPALGSKVKRPITAEAKQAGQAWKTGRRDGEPPSPPTFISRNGPWISICMLLVSASPSHLDISLLLWKFTAPSTCLRTNQWNYIPHKIPWYQCCSKTDFMALETWL